MRHNDNYIKNMKKFQFIFMCTLIFMLNFKILF